MRYEDEVCLVHFSPHVSDGFCDYVLATQFDRPLDDLDDCDIQPIRWEVIR